MNDNAAKSKIYDVAIVGAGPAGAACAISLAKEGLEIALIDKETFPRDKTCGDALSIDVINQLALLGQPLLGQFVQMENKIASYGIKIFSADFTAIDIPLVHNNVYKCGYVSPRLHFDNLLYQYAKSLPGVSCFENCAVQKIVVDNHGVTMATKQHQMQAKIIIGADGAHSMVGKQLAGTLVNKKYHSAGLRIYYEGVTGFAEKDLIELHFFKDVVPGYLWVFPLANGRANVGIGMLSHYVSKRKVNLKQTLQRLLQEHPHLSSRFVNATPLETVKGYGLPLGGKKNSISGHRYLLTGDAASLIDPFSGEGIANAIRSGRIAATHAANAIKANDFSAKKLKEYDQEIYRKMWKEFKVSTLLQKLIMYPWLCNLIVRKANTNQYIQQLLVEALANVDKRKSVLTQPGFYFNLFFKGGKKVA